MTGQNLKRVVACAMCVFGCLVVMLLVIVLVAVMVPVLLLGVRLFAMLMTNCRPNVHNLKSKSIPTACNKNTHTKCGRFVVQVPGKTADLVNTRVCAC